MTDIKNSAFHGDIDDKPKKSSAKGRVFQCTGFPGCTMSFTRSEHLARHKRKHTGERPFTCPFCSKKFSRLDNLRQHKQTVHAYETFISKDTAAASHPGPQSHAPHVANPSTPNNRLFSSGYPPSSTNGNGMASTIHHRAPPHPYLTASLMSPPSSQSPHYTQTSSHVHYSQSLPHYGYRHVPPPLKSNSVSSPHHPEYLHHHSQQMAHPQLPPLSQDQNRPDLRPASVSEPDKNSSSSSSSSSYIVPIQPAHDVRSSDSLDKDTTVPPPPTSLEKSPPHHEYKPKRRPRPLSLQHSFVKNNYGSLPLHRDDNSSSPSSSASSSPLVTGGSLPYSSCASLTSSIVSPLSPLFHQSFNQTVNKYANTRISGLNNSYRIPSISSSSGNSNGNGNGNSSWLKDVLNREQTSSAPNLTSQTLETQSNIGNGAPPLLENENSSEEKTPTVNSLSTEEPAGENSKGSDTTMSAVQSSPKDIYVSKKPTINSLLSPTSADTFADKVASKISSFPPLPSVEE